MRAEARVGQWVLLRREDQILAVVAEDGHERAEESVPQLVFLQKGAASSAEEAGGPVDIPFGLHRIFSSPLRSLAATEQSGKPCPGCPVMNGTVQCIAVSTRKRASSLTDHDFDLVRGFGGLGLERRGLERLEQLLSLVHRQVQRRLQDTTSISNKQPRAINANSGLTSSTGVVMVLASRSTTQISGSSDSPAMYAGCVPTAQHGNTEQYP